MSKILKQFAVTDGLLRGVALSSNLVTTAAIALLPAFGVSGILMSAFIQLSIAGCLEVPTGWIADRYGWVRSVRYALELKAFVTAAFLAALLCAANGHVGWAWGFIAGEAIIDAFASSFLNGAYQAAYLKWYESQISQAHLSVSQPPPLFLASFRYAAPIRFGIPIAVGALGFFLGSRLPVFSAMGTYGVATACVLAVLVLRAVTFIRVSRDLREVKAEDFRAQACIRGFGRPFLKALLGEVSQSRASFVVYWLASFLSALASLYLVGQSLHAFQNSSLFPDGMAGTWIPAIALGLSFYVLDTAFSMLILPLLSKRNRLIPWVGIILSAVSALAIVPLIREWRGDGHAVLRLAALAIFTLTTLVLSSALQRYIASSLTKTVSEAYRATWLSLGSALSYLAFGMASGSLLLFQLSKWGPVFFAFITAFIGIGLAVILYYLRSHASRSKQRKLRHVFAVSFFTAAILGAAVFTILDLGSFAVSSLKMRVDAEDQIAGLALSAIEEPLFQGSFTEAASRLKGLMERGTIACGRISAWNFQVDLCDPALLPAIGKEISRPIAMESSPGTPAGHLSLWLDRATLWREIFTRCAISLALFFVGALILYTLLRRLSQRIETEMDELVEVAHAQGRSSEEKTKGVETFEIREFQELSDQFEKVFAELRTSAKSAAVAEVASQVEHDIRSPLAALETLAGTLTVLPEDDRVLLRGAVSRIRDILYTLAPDHPQDPPAARARFNSTGVQPLDQRLAAPLADDETAPLISSLIDEIICEKRMQYQSRADVEIQADLGEAAYGLFARIEPANLKRLLSNLINNGVESLGIEGGLVQVRLISGGDRALILVSDNGRGIPADILPKLAQKGATHSKEGGSGLGLYSARRVLEEAGGKLVIESELGRGTTVRLDLPSVPVPAWFVGELRIQADDDLVILDDDPSIHQIWRRKFEAAAALSHAKSFRVFHFTRASELRAWHGQHASPQAIYLLDYELRGDPITGLELAKELGIEDRSILVTSHFEERALRARARALSVRMIPKRLAGFVPVRVDLSRAASPDLILIDDEKLTHRMWDRAARARKKILRAYHDPEQALVELRSFDRSIPIYVDHRLGRGVSGARVAERLHEEGFRRIYLTTGDSLAKIPKLPFLSGVIGKVCPLLSESAIES